MSRRRWRGLAAATRSAAISAASVWVLAACVVVPVTRDVYDADCRMMRREVTLEAAAVAQFYSCGGQECAAMLVAIGVVSAATLVVSGSIAVVGNAVFWLEHEANCRQRKDGAPAKS
jgi:hypothetical protein